MKKFMRTILAFIFVFALTACGAKKEISLPEAKEITEIEITENPSGNTVKITEQDEIAKRTRASFIYMETEIRPMLNNPIQESGGLKKKHLKRLAVN